MLYYCAWLSIHDLKTKITQNVSQPSAVWLIMPCDFEDHGEKRRSTPVTENEKSKQILGKLKCDTFLSLKMS